MSKESVTFIEPVSGQIKILKQIHEVNDDGSYTFGYIDSAGTFRVEHKNDNGHVTGKFGYIDADGQIQTSGKNIGTLKKIYQYFGNCSSMITYDFSMSVCSQLEYVAGLNVAGQSLGYKSMRTILSTHPNNSSSRLASLEFVNDHKMLQNEESVVIGSNVGATEFDKSFETILQTRTAVSQEQPKFFQYGQSIFRSPSAVATQITVSNSKQSPPSRIDMFIQNLKSKTVLDKTRRSSRTIRSINAFGK